VPIVVLPLPLPLRSRSSSSLKAILTSLSDAPSAARQGRNVREMAATEVVAQVTVRDDKCSPPPVPSVAKTLKSRSNPVKAGRCIVAIATAPSDQAGKAGFQVADTGREYRSVSVTSWLQAIDKKLGI
jgi:hypothetical protein